MAAVAFYASLMIMWNHIAHNAEAMPISIGQINRAKALVYSLDSRQKESVALKALIESKILIDYNEIYVNYVLDKKCPEQCRSAALIYLYASGRKVNLAERIVKDINNENAIIETNCILLPNGAKCHVKLWHLLISSSTCSLDHIKAESYKLIEMNASPLLSDVLKAYVFLKRPEVFGLTNTEISRYDVIMALQSDSDPKSSLLAEKYARFAKIPYDSSKVFNDVEISETGKLELHRNTNFKNGSKLKLYILATSQLEQRNMKEQGLDKLKGQSTELFLFAKYLIARYGLDKDMSGVP